MGLKTSGAKKTSGGRREHGASNMERSDLGMTSPSG